jgi:hypothetical protein
MSSANTVAKQLFSTPSNTQTLPGEFWYTVIAMCIFSEYFQGTWSPIMFILDLSAYVNHYMGTIQEQLMQYSLNYVL